MGLRVEPPITRTSPWRNLLPTVFRGSILAVLVLGIVCWTGLNRTSVPHARASDEHSAYTLAAPLALTATATASPSPFTYTAHETRTGTRSISHLEQVRELAQRDPWALARLGQEQYAKSIREYSCVFQKQERIGNKLRDLEEIEVRFRQDPQAVYMIWKKNADQAKRALFIDSPDFVDKKGEKLAKVEPAGALIRLVVSEVMMPIHGKRARQSSRRSIDEFGFYNTFNLLNRYNTLGRENGVLDLRYEGEGLIDGRPTFIIVRYLPYTGPNGLWPDAKMVMHLDQEWLLPTAVYSYSDRDGKELLGSYVTTQVRLNPGFTDKDFQF